MVPIPQAGSAPQYPQQPPPQYGGGNYAQPSYGYGDGDGYGGGYGGGGRYNNGRMGTGTALAAGAAAGLGGYLIADALFDGCGEMTRAPFQSMSLLSKKNVAD
jgi:hypothetical protein